MALQLKIQLSNVAKPPVWRRILLPETLTFHDLHKIIQLVFGWENYHLYMFNPQGYGSKPMIALPSEEDWTPPDYDSSKTRLDKILKSPKQTFTYIYDFGDDWIHKITIEDIQLQAIKSPVCLGGKGACPPEDCGGPYGYENLKKILVDPSNEEYDEYREWLGLDENEEWEPNQFDVNETNHLLKAVFPEAD